MILIREDFNDKYNKSLSVNEFEKLYIKTIDFVNLKTFGRLKILFKDYGAELLEIKTKYPIIYDYLVLAIENYLLTFELEFNSLINEKVLIAGQSKRLGDWSTSYNGSGKYDKYSKLDNELADQYLTHTNLNNPTLMCLKKIIGRW